MRFFQFTREDKNVRFHAPGVLNYSFHFLWSAQSDHEAELLRADFEKRFGNALQRAREEAYNRGWRDAKAKRRKETWFSRGLGTE